jgi:hypothetical protein
VGGGVDVRACFVVAVCGWWLWRQPWMGPIDPRRLTHPHPTNNTNNTNTNRCSGGTTRRGSRSACGRWCARARRTSNS